VATAKIRDVALLRIASAFGPNDGFCFGSAMAGFFGVMAQSVVCDGSDVIQTITERCEPSDDSIVIRLINFVHCASGAIFIGSRAVVSISSCSFLDCSAVSYGGCAYLNSVNSGNTVFDSCATKCRAFAGSFVYVQSSDVDVTLRVLSLFDCSSEYGALCDWYAREVTSSSNLTSLKRANRGVPGSDDFHLLPTQAKMRE
jgi:hypothetical protein